MYVQQRLDVEVVSCQDNFEKHFLIDSNELLIPFADVSCTFASVIVIRVGSWDRFPSVVFAVF